MKNPFRWASMTKSQTDLGKLIAIRTRLLSKQAAAQVALDRALDADSKFLQTGDEDAALNDKRKGAVKDALAELTRYKKPLSDLAPQIVATENAVALETLAFKQENAARRLGERTDAIETLYPVWLGSTLGLIAALDAAAPAHYEMSQVAGFLRNACSEVEMACDIGVGNLRNFVEAIRGGHMSVPRDVPVVPAKPPAAEKPKLTKVFSSHALTWLDENGSQRVIAKWHDIELPHAAAAFALQVGLAVLPDNPLCAKSRGHSPGHPEPGWLNDLDARVGPNISVVDGEPRQPPVDPIRSSSGPFQIVDRGPAVQMKVAR
jgi:hypothetical protein